MSNLSLPTTEAGVLAEAEANWAAITELDPEIAERAALAAAGVDQQQIWLLYPFAFGNLVPGLLPLVRPEAFIDFSNQLDAKQRLRNLQTRLGVLTVQKPPAVQAALDAASGSSEISQLRELMLRFNACMPDALPSDAAGEASRHAGAIMWYACTMYAHRAAFDAEGQYQVREFLVLAVATLLPALRSPAF